MSTNNPRRHRRTTSAIECPDSFSRRVSTASRWLDKAGMTDQTPEILASAADFAGTDEDAFLAFIAWKIKAFQVRQLSTR